MQLLRQSTAQIVPLGPFVDATDGATLETAITWSTGEAALIKNGASSIVNIGTNTWSAHLGGGMYNVTLTVTDTDTLGLLSIVGYDSAARPVRRDFMVVPANVYDAFVAGSDLLDINVNKFSENSAAGLLTGTTMLRADGVGIAGSTSAATKLAASAAGIVSGTVQTGSSTTNIKTDLTDTQNDHYNGRVIVFTSGTQNRVAATINDYDGATKSLSISAIPSAPSNGDTFVIV